MARFPDKKCQAEFNQETSNSYNLTWTIFSMNITLNYSGTPGYFSLNSHLWVPPLSILEFDVSDQYSYSFLAETHSIRAWRFPKCFRGFNIGWFYLTVLYCDNVNVVPLLGDLITWAEVGHWFDLNLSGSEQWLSALEFASRMCLVTTRRLSSSSSSWAIQSACSCHFIDIYTSCSL